jgi:DNA invertase Pin-like site-specific DNA recombinase
MRVAIYTRVSKSDGSQKVSRQLSELRKFCKESSWTIVEEIQEYIGGKMKRREGTEKLVSLARGNHIQKIIVHEISRLGRNLSDVAVTVESLTDQNCSVYDYKTRMETLDESNKKTIFFHIILPIFAGIAQQWLEDHSYRIKSGLEQTRLKGKRIGRPKAVKLKKEEEITALLSTGLSIRKTAAELDKAEIKKALSDPELQLSFH